MSTTGSAGKNSTEGLPTTGFQIDNWELKGLLTTGACILAGRMSVRYALRVGDKLLLSGTGAELVGEVTAVHRDLHILGRADVWVKLVRECTPEEITLLRQH